MRKLITQQGNKRITIVLLGCVEMTDYEIDGEEFDERIGIKPQEPPRFIFRY